MYCGPSLSRSDRMFINRMNEWPLSINTPAVLDKQKMVSHYKGRSSASSTLPYPVWYQDYYWKKYTAYSVVLMSFAILSMVP